LDTNLALFRRALAGEIDGYQLEKRLIHKQGHPVWIHLSAGAVRDATGQVRYFVGQVQDITERKEAERTLRASEERYRAVVSNFPQGAVLLFDEELRHVFAGGPGLSAAGLARTRLEGQTVYEAFPAEMTAIFAPHYQRALAGQTAAFDLDHEERTYHVQVVPMASAAQAGSARAGMVVLQDVTEQRRARAELALERTQGAYYSALSQEFRTLAEHSPDIIMRFDRTGRQLYTNHAGTMLLGIAAEKCTGKTLSELRVSRTIFAPWEQALQKVFATGEAQTFDAEAALADPLADGQARYLHVRVVPEVAEDGSLRSALVIATDVTKLRQTELQLTQQASELEAIFEAQADSVIVVDAAEQVIRMNAAAQAFFGRRVGDGLTHSAEEVARWLDLRDGEGSPLSMEEIPTARLLRGEVLSGAQAITLRIRVRDGEERTVSLTGGPLRDAQGHITGAVGVVHDISELKQAQEALERQERQFRTLVEHSPDIITRFDRALRQIYVSPNAAHVLDIQARQRVGKTYGELGVPAAIYAPWEHALRSVFATGEPCAFDMTSPYGRTGDAGGFHYHVRYIPERAADGSVASVLGITTDITPLKRTEEALRQASAAAEAARQEEERRRGEAELREEIAESLRDVLAILNSNRSLEEILHSIVRQASRLLGSKATAIYGAPNSMPLRHAEQAVRLVLQAADGLGVSLDGHPDLPAFAQTAVHCALTTQWPVAILNVCVPPAESATPERDATETTIPIHAEALPTPYQAALVVPIVVHEEAYGCLLLCYTWPCRFLPDDVTLALAYADQVALALANARLQSHLDRAARVAERTRIAGELHDTVTQDILAAKRLAEAIPRNWDRHRAEAERALEQVHALTHGAVAGLRVLLLELRPTALEQMPLGDLLRQLSEAMTIRAAAPIAVRIEGDELPLPIEVKVALYRVAQEALTNAAKYAAARSLLVRLRRWRTGKILLEISDDGQGFDPDAIPPGHLGIAMMRERAHAIGATIRLRSQPKRGTRVLVEWRSQRPRATHVARPVPASARTRPRGAES
jgi:two-component system nitrate/nitrite sensor histidine kinase NarX